MGYSNELIAENEALAKENKKLKKQLESSVQLPCMISKGIFHFVLQYNKMSSEIEVYKYLDKKQAEAKKGEIT